MLIAIPAGIGIHRNPRWQSLTLGTAGVLQTIPSIALLGFLIPVMGIGAAPAIVALFLYALLPILRNTFTGLQGVPDDVREAARGMGMSPLQILLRVELTLALPVILAGVRTATVINVGVATLAAYIGAGGLGTFIFSGIATVNSLKILAGAVPAALLAVLLDALLGRLSQMPERVLLKRLPLLLGMGVLGLAVGYGASVFSGSGSKGNAGLMAGFPPEFMDRADGYAGLQKVYGIEIPVKTLNSSLMYRAAAEGEVDVISGYSTDGRIKAFDLFTLEDDKHLFPPYFAAPLIRIETAKAYPEVVEALSLLSGRISDSLMAELNYRVDVEKQEPKDVAESFLKEMGLWRAPRNGGGETFVIGSKIFSEQYTLAYAYAFLVAGYTDLEPEVKAGLGGTQIVFEAMLNGEVDCYPEYTGTGFQVQLTPDSLTQARMITDAEGIYEYVDSAFQVQYGIDWLEPLGFNNTYALLMRRAQAQELGIESISDLGEELEK